MQRRDGESQPCCASFRLPATSSHLCCASFLHPTPAAGGARRPTTSSKASRSSFVSTTNSSLLPSSLFTDHESLPPLADAFSNFLSVYPDYALTQLADRLRQLHYPHLSLHIPLDYSGFPLFSPSSTASFTIVASSGGGSADNDLESAIKAKIMSFLNLPREEYRIVLAANRASALKLLADSYPFRSNRRLLTVYDHESEAVSAMLEASARREAKVMTAGFQWPSMRIQSSKLRKMLGVGKTHRGLFLFPLQSRVTGTRYSYLWMSFAQQNGWHVALDASALGPKDMDTLGLSLFRPDFLVCNFFKVLGEDPSGFACLIVKNDAAALLGTSPTTGAVRIIPSHRPDYASGSDTGDDSRTFTVSAPVVATVGEIVEESETTPPPPSRPPVQIECSSLDHADELGLGLIGSRLRCLVNWLVLALGKLRHPHAGDGQAALVRIYGPKVKFDRGPAIAFNLFDWKGEKVEPELVQKLADRSNISLACALLHNVWFSDERESGLEKKASGSASGLSVVTASLGFLASFEDVYNLWVFIAKFLDADFVEKERWRCVALNRAEA